MSVVSTFYYSDSTSSTFVGTAINSSSYNSGKSLVSATIGEGVLSLNNNCFKNVNTLTSVSLPSTLTIIDNSCFESTSISSLIMPNSVTHIGTSCFAQCTNLTNVHISTSLTFLDNRCFDTCSSLSSIVLPSSMTHLHNSCFSGCSSLTTIVFPSNLNTIDQQCFASCPNLTTVIFHNQNNFTSAGGQVFQNNTQSINVTYYSTASQSNLTSASQQLQGEFPGGSTFTYNPNPSCFNEGTKILCLNRELQESWIPIENLRKGDLVKTYLHGYRKIELIGKGYGKNIDKNLWNINMFIMKKSETNGLLEDLIVTGGHGILVDELNEYKEENDKKFNGSTPKIDDKFILLAGVSKDFIILPEGYEFNYYHLVLEEECYEGSKDDKRYGIWANGILSEIPSKKQFLEAHYEMIE